MHTKNNTNQQIMPTHNRDNKNCDISDKREYEVNLDKKYFLINFSSSEKLEKSSDRLRNDCQRSRDHMKRPEKEITLFSPTKKEMRNKK